VLSCDVQPWNRINAGMVSKRVRFMVDLLRYASCGIPREDIGVAPEWSRHAH
jgi:hypothetical protein